MRNFVILRSVPVLQDQFLVSISQWKLFLYFRTVVCLCSVLNKSNVVTVGPQFIRFHMSKETFLIFPDHSV